MGMIPFLRDRMLADDRFMFKARPTAPRPAPTPLRQEPRLPVRMQLGVEIAIDAGCATFAEVRALPAPRGWDRHPALEAASTRVAPCQVRKRADEFWAEFEFYLSDLIVGVALDAALVSMMANPATLGTTSLTARLAKAGAKARSPRACSSATPRPPAAEAPIPPSARAAGSGPEAAARSRGPSLLHLCGCAAGPELHRGAASGVIRRQVPGVRRRGHGLRLRRPGDR